MTNVDFTTTFAVQRTPEEVFAAINNVRGWWSGNIVATGDGPPNQKEHEDGGVRS
jgi:hypothetical protein